VDSYGNLSNNNPESPIFFCFVSGLATSTEISEVVSYRLPLQTRWILCANEGQVCFFSGAQVVGYGSQGIPVVYKQAIERILCNSESFNATLRGNSTENQCYLSVTPEVFAVSKYNSSSIDLMSPSERLNLFVAFRNSSVGVDLSLFSSPECSPHSLVARVKSGLSLNCTDLRKIALFQCIQVDGVLSISETGFYEFGFWTADDVMMFMGSEMVLRSTSTSKVQFYSFSKYFNALDSVLIRASVLPSGLACLTTFVWKKSIPGVV